MFGWSGRMMMNIMIAVVVGALGISFGSLYVLRLIRAVFTNMTHGRDSENNHTREEEVGYKHTVL